MTGPSCRLVDRIVRAEYLGTAGYHGVAAGCRVGAGFLGVRIGARANQVSLADEGGNVVSWSVIPFDESGVGLTRFGIGEQHATP